MTGESARRASVPGEQRVFSLVLALVASPQGATKHELLSSVYGYADRYQSGEGGAALERQFERDKVQLRELGIPVETIDSPQESGNNQLTRYRISKELLQMPASLRFTERELALLHGAALAWREGSLTTEARRSVMKLESLGAGLDVQHLGVAPSLGISEPAAAELQRAIESGLVARFDYRLPSRETPLARRVAPLTLHRADGRWHLIAHDLERDAHRVFLLSRISGEVRVGPEEFDAALAGGVEATIAELLERERRLRATLRLRAGSTAEARLAPRARALPSDDEGAVLADLGTLDFDELAVEIASYGPDAQVLAPPELRERVAALLGSIREQHGEQARDANTADVETTEAPTAGGDDG